VPYAETTVPALVASHRGRVAEVLAIVDCVRPQKTQMIDPEVKFPRAAFEGRVTRIREIAESFRRAGVIDRIVTVEEGSAQTSRLLKKYVGPLVKDTHDCYGCGLVSYLYGFEECRTQYLLHYDADMLLYQASGYDWSTEGLAVLQSDEKAIAATPRVSPPFADALRRSDSPSLHEGDAPIEARQGYWRLGWFSARCFLVDLSRLKGWLPLLGLRVPRALAEVVARRILQRGYPVPTEMMIHWRAQRERSYRVDLMSERAFVLHPNDKGDLFLRLLPEILRCVKRGEVPRAQLGWENVLLTPWAEHLGSHACP